VIDLMPLRADALLLETTLTDSPAFLDVLLERVMASGALDAWTRLVHDAHGHPGIRLSVVIPAVLRDEIERVIVTNSSADTITVTAAEVSRIETSSELVTTRWGDISITHRRLNGRIIDIEPDTSQCAAYARAHDISAKTVWHEAYRIGEARIGQKR
jgi:uncharacterized protein (DUF111 family)